MNLIDKFIDKKSILLANGEDIEILKLNIRFNNFERSNKRFVNYINLKKTLNRIDKKKNYDTENLNKIFKFKINFHLHNASNDCVVIYKSLRKLIKIYGKKEFEDMIAQNKELIKFWIYCYKPTLRKIFKSLSSCFNYLQLAAVGHVDK